MELPTRKKRSAERKNLMERKFLENLGLEKDVMDKILDQNMNEIGIYKTQLKTKETEVATLRNDLIAANTKIADFEKVDVQKLQNDLAAEKAARIKDKQQWNLQKTLQESGCKDVDYIIYKLGDTVQFAEDGTLKNKDDVLSQCKESFAALFENSNTPSGMGSLGNFQRSHGSQELTERERLEKDANDASLPLPERVMAREKLFKLKEE